MARTFDRTAANHLDIPTNTLGPLLNGVAAISAHAWAKFTSFDAGSGANSDRVLQVNIALTTTTGLIIAVDSSGGGASHKVRFGGRSVSGDALGVKSGTTDLVTGTWYSMGGVFDVTGKTSTPYLNGTAEGGGAVTLTNTTYTNGVPTGPDQISGAALGTASQVDGVIAEVAIWTAALTAGEMIALSKGFSAKLIRPQSLIFYCPIMGNNATEPELSRSLLPAVQGTLPKADHPRIIYPMDYENRRFAAAGGGGGGGGGGSGNLTAGGASSYLPLFAAHRRRG